MTSPAVAYIDATGCHVPNAIDVLAYLQAQYRGIFGQDIAFDSSDQDTQWIGVIMAAINDANAEILAAYNSRSPTTAQGTGLSSIVKINGIERKTASYSTAPVSVIGEAGTSLTDCRVSDGTYQWSIPDLVIPFGGEAKVTATCLTIGAIAASKGTINQLSTPTKGLQSIVNTDAASPGAPIETDPQLRVRQTQSTMLASTTVLDGIEGTLLALPGVTGCKAYENDSNVTDANGIPGHAISIVVDGGDAQAIGEVIAAKKTPGGGTYGTAVAVVTSAQGVSRNIGFFRRVNVPITYVIRVKALKGYTLDIEALLKQTVSDWTNALGIGTSVYLARTYVPANLTGNPAASTFELLSVTVARDRKPTSSQDVPIGFNEAPFCDPSYVEVVVGK